MISVEIHNQRYILGYLLIIWRLSCRPILSAPMEFNKVSDTQTESGYKNAL